MNAPDTTDWNTRLRQLVERPDLQNGPAGRGRVLRVKLGYNPNSSSVGSVVTVLMWSVVLGSTMLNAMAALARTQFAGSRALPHLPDDDGNGSGPTGSAGP